MRQVEVAYDDGSGNTRHARFPQYHMVNAVCYFDDEDGKYGKLALIVPINRIYYIRYL